MSWGSTLSLLHFYSFHIISILKRETITLHLFCFLEPPNHFFLFVQCRLLLVFFPLLTASWKTGHHVWYPQLLAQECVHSGDSMQAVLFSIESNSDYCLETKRVSSLGI